MLISSWNVNSVRARIENIKSYLLKYKPDILMMQEIKTEDVNFPYDDFSSMDYESHVFGQKSYNGVAIISKNKLNDIKNDIFKDKNKQSRVISAEVKHKNKNITLINIYTPNGNPVDTDKYTYKLYWLDSLIKKLKSLSKQNENIIIGGDFNIIPAAEEGISESTLSVPISNNISSNSIDSPTFFLHSRIVPSLMDSPIFGITTSTII